MNILPKKRWHVRTKDNIARVRRDEAQAAEEEKKKLMRIQIAEREARTEALRKKARQQYESKIPLESSSNVNTALSESSSDKHVNLFYELESNEVVSNKTNEEYEREKKLEKEKYEKQIGYLTYLGQDTNEITGQVSWYNKPREEVSDKQEEVSLKQKAFEDPLEDIRKYLGCDGIKKETAKVEKTDTKELIRRWKLSDGESTKRKKHKKEKKSKHKKKKHKRKRSSESESDVEVKEEKKVDLERLRAERIRREREERQRADELFARLNGVEVKKKEVEPETHQRYNSQFNPHLAKQNYVG